MNFSTASKVRSVIDATEQVEFNRSENRDKIAKGINGFPPLSIEKAKQMGLKINISWLEETVLAKQANLQYLNAFQSRPNYFTIDCPSMPPENRTDWCLKLTQFINRPMKKSREYSALMDNEFSSVVAHGISPKIWLFKDNWLADFVALNDFRVPTDTETSLKNLCWFGVRRRYTVGELVKAVFGKYADSGWDKPAIIKILVTYWDKNWETVDYDWSTDPEKMTQLVKQNMGFYTSDAVPVITLWHFYHMDDENPLAAKWLMKVVPDKVTQGVDLSETKFLFDSDEPVADKLDELIHIQFGDLNGTPPYLYHSVRSLGFLLHETCFWMNLFRCRLFQHTWENFNLLWRSADGSPKARAQFLELFHKGFVPNEVTIIPKEQKNDINQELVEFVMSQAKQLMGEASASYTQDIDTGTQREQTLGEAQIKLQQSNAMMTGLLATAARNKVFEYREICRRFCKRKSLNPDARKFRERCVREGIPVKYLDPDLWDISCDMPLGSGNQTLEMAQATQLMSVRTAHSPEAQQIILHTFDAAITQNPQLAQKLVPLGVKTPVSTGSAWAASIFGSLMQGIPVPQQFDLSPVDQITVLIGMLAGVVQKVTQTDNIGTPDDLAGMTEVLRYLKSGNPDQPGLIDTLAEDRMQKGAVKGFEDQIGQLTNLIKGFSNRQAQVAKAGSSKLAESLSIKFTDLDAYPAAQAAILASQGLPAQKVEGEDPKMKKAQQAMAIKEAGFAQKTRHQELQFQLEQARANIQTVADITAEEQKHRQELAHAALDKAVELMNGNGESKPEKE